MEGHLDGPRGQLGGNGGPVAHKDDIANQEDAQKKDPESRFVSDRDSMIVIEDDIDNLDLVCLTCLESFLTCLPGRKIERAKSRREREDNASPSLAQGTGWSWLGDTNDPGTGVPRRP